MDCTEFCGPLTASPVPAGDRLSPTRFPRYANVYPLRAYAVVAAGQLKKFAAIATAIGSSNWLGLDAMSAPPSSATAPNSRLDMPSHPCGCPILMRAFRYAPAVGKLSRVKLDALVEEATVDSNGEDEQVMGLYTMIADNLATPFQTTVLGVEVTVEDIDLTGLNTIVAHCSRGAFRQAICVLDLPLPTPPPDGSEWIEAYRHWAR